ncbi:hypothetical protein V1523DRAFT_430924 [Lipomyces doorenjongii]
MHTIDVVFMWSAVTDSNPGFRRMRQLIVLLDSCNIHSLDVRWNIPLSTYVHYQKIQNRIQLWIILMFRLANAVLAACSLIYHERIHSGKLLSIFIVCLQTTIRNEHRQSTVARTLTTYIQMD